MNFTLPTDLKKLNIEELKRLADDIRAEILSVVKKNGGHLASNLGVVELTIALHYVFDFPTDQIVFDVGHQCYTHKILSQGIEAFQTIRADGGISGFPKTEESPYDSFNTGHASTALSVAMGLAKARDLKGESHEVIALIGDGSLSGGLFYEALNNVETLNGKVIVVLNDNQMSISKTVGGLSKGLTKMRVSLRYKKFKRRTKRFFQAIPFIGKWVARGVERIRNGFSRLLIHRNDIFEQMGLKYVGPIDGNDLEDLIDFLQKVKKYDAPVLLHVCTKKGKGDKLSEEYPAEFHGVQPQNSTYQTEYSTLLSETLIDLARKDSSVVAVCAAMSDATGLQAFQKEFPNRFFDVGIAESHAVTFAAALAKQGFKPYVAIYSTFLQRAYDQVLHDVCLQNLPVTFCIDRASLAPSDGETHQGIYDLSYLQSIPNIRIFAPTNGKEFQSMLQKTAQINSPVALRYPRTCHSPFNQDHDDDIFRWKRLSDESTDKIILAVGENALQIADKVKSLVGDVSVVSARCVKPLDKDFLNQLNGKTVISIEENVAPCGFGEAVASYLYQNDVSCKFRAFSLDDCVIPHGNKDKLYQKYGLNTDTMVAFLRGETQ